MEQDTPIPAWLAKFVRDQNEKERRERERIVRENAEKIRVKRFKEEREAGSFYLLMFLAGMFLMSIMTTALAPAVAEEQLSTASQRAPIDLAKVDALAEACFVLLFALAWFLFFNVASKKVNFISHFWLRRYWVIALGAFLAFLSWITWRTFRVPITDFDPVKGRPLGYSISLLFFVMPIIVGALLLIAHNLSIRSKVLAETGAEGEATSAELDIYATDVLSAPVLITAILWFVLGGILDIFFAVEFFTFENWEATWEGRWFHEIPGFDWTWPLSWSWVSDYIPIEEFLFYYFGAIYVIIVYMWLNGVIMTHYKTPVEEYRKVEAADFKNTTLLPEAFFLTALAITFYFKVSRGSILPWDFWSRFKELELTNFQAWLPGYAWFQIFVFILPVLILRRYVSRLINHRALIITCMAVFINGLAWEAMLGVRFKWWGYQEKYMMDLYVPAWNKLPLEAVWLWVLVALPTVYFYEYVRLRFHAKEVEVAATSADRDLEVRKMLTGWFGYSRDAGKFLKKNWRGRAEAS